MRRISLKDLKKRQVIMEESSYGNNIFVVLSDSEFDSSKNYWEVKVREVVSNQESTLVYNPDYAYEPNLFLLN